MTVREYARWRGRSFIFVERLRSETHGRRIDARFARFIPCERERFVREIQISDGGERFNSSMYRRTGFTSY